MKMLVKLLRIGETVSDIGNDSNLPPMQSCQTMSEANSRFVQVETLPPEYADKILSAPSIDRVRTLYNVTFPLMIVAAIGLLVWAGILHGKIVDDGDSSEGTFATALFVLGTGLFAVVITVSILVGSRNRWLRRVARKEINRRADKIVDLDAPGIRFVEIVPKSAWNDTTLLENATDVGFLDLRNGYLLFEGDNERYHIPACAIVKCEQDCYTRLARSPSAQHSNTTIIRYHFVVVTMKLSEKMSVEVPFRIRASVSLWSDKKASDANYKFLQDINRLKATVSVSPKI
jgi:hypothetical protein